MQQKQVVQLIESVVRPLRQKIAHLQKQNQRLKAQISAQHPPRHDYLRQRSSSKEERPASKKTEQKHAQSPIPDKKKEDKNDKPVWGYARGVKPEIQVKLAPQPKDKIPLIPSSPKMGNRAPSKQKLEAQKRPGEKGADKKIAGGKKADLPVQQQPSNPQPRPPVEGPTTE